MQVITTKYLGPTNTRESRIKATSSSGLSVTIPLDHSMSMTGRHTKAALALARNMGWTGELHLVGDTKEGYVYSPHIYETFKIE